MRGSRPMPAGLSSIMSTETLQGLPIARAGHHSSRRPLQGWVIGPPIRASSAMSARLHGVLSARCRTRHANQTLAKPAARGGGQRPLTRASPRTRSTLRTAVARPDLGRPSSVTPGITDQGARTRHNSQPTDDLRHVTDEIMLFRLEGGEVLRALSLLKKSESRQLQASARRSRPVAPFRPSSAVRRADLQRLQRPKFVRPGRPRRVG